MSVQENVKKVVIIGGVRRDNIVLTPKGFDPFAEMKSRATVWGYEWGGSATRTAFEAWILGGMNITHYTKGSRDEEGKMFSEAMLRMNIKYVMHEVRKFPANFVFLSGANRAGILCDYPEDDEPDVREITQINLTDCAGLYLDGRLASDAYRHAKEARCPIVLDGCQDRPNTDDMLRIATHVIASRLLCKELGLTPLQFLELLKSYGHEFGAVTLSEHGVLWFGKDGVVHHLPVLIVPRILNTNGTGDFFHALFFWSLIMRPELGILDHLLLARAGTAHALGDLGPKRYPRHEDIAIAMKLPAASPLQPHQLDRL